MSMKLGDTSTLGFLEEVKRSTVRVLVWAFFFVFFLADLYNAQRAPMNLTVDNGSRI